MTQSLLQKQYKAQVNRIRKGYRSIEKMGGIFSESIEQIIKPPKRITQATIRRLKGITKESLYRRAKTETGESGWRLRLQVRKEAAEKAQETRRTIQYVQDRLNALTFAPNAKRSLKEVYKEWKGKTYLRQKRKQSLAEFARDFIEIEEGYEEEAKTFSWDTFDEDDLGTQIEYEDAILDNFSDRVSANLDNAGVNQVYKALQDSIARNGRRATADLLNENSGEALKLLDDVLRYKENAFAQARPLNKLLMLLYGGVTPLDRYEATNETTENLRNIDGQLVDIETGEIVSADAIYSVDDVNDEEDYY